MKADFKIYGYLKEAPEGQLLEMTSVGLAVKDKAALLKFAEFISYCVEERTSMETGTSTISTFDGFPNDIPTLKFQGWMRGMFDASLQMDCSRHDNPPKVLA